MSGALDPGGEKEPAGNDVADAIEMPGIVIAVRLAHRASAADASRALCEHADQGEDVDRERFIKVILRDLCELCGLYSGINANVHTDPPAGTLDPAKRLANAPPSPETTVTYCRPLCV